MKIDLYENYTSTSVLFGVDEKEFTRNSAIYFNKNLLQHFGANKDSRILEIGCGYGRYTKAMLEAGYQHVIGIDISKEQVTYAREQLGLSNVYVADAIEYLDKGEQYDLILLMDVLEHLDLEYAVLLLRKVYENLRPGGRFIIHVPNSLSPFRPSYYGDVTHVRSFSVDSMSQILRMGGFQKFSHYPLPPMALGLKSAIRRLLWLGVISPAIKLLLKISNGSTSGGIYTSNLLTVAVK
jgi:SAM-dependent methyltransferase